QRIAEMASALADNLCQIGLSIAEFITEPLIAGRFLERIEVGALDIFDDRKFERLAVVGLEAHDWHLMQSCALRRPPAPLPGDDFVDLRIARQRAGKDRLKDALFLERGGELVERIGTKILPRVARIGAQKFDRNFLRAARARRGGKRLRSAKKRGQTASQTLRRLGLFS